jgi:hypothetical protein
LVEALVVFFQINLNVKAYVVAPVSTAKVPSTPVETPSGVRNTSVPTNTRAYPKKASAVSLAISN